MARGPCSSRVRMNGADPLRGGCLRAARRSAASPQGVPALSRKCARDPRAPSRGPCHAPLASKSVLAFSGFSMPDRIPNDSAGIGATPSPSTGPLI